MPDSFIRHYNLFSASMLVAAPSNVPLRESDKPAHPLPPNAEALAAVPAPLRFELQPRDFPKAFDAVARQVSAALQGLSEQPEKTAQALLEQFMLLRFLEVKGWLSEADVLRQQCQLHCQLDPEATGFFSQVIAPRVRVLAQTGLLFEPQPVPALPNRIGKIICDTLLSPFRFSIHEASGKEADKLLDPEWLGSAGERALLERPLTLAQSAQTQRRIRATFQTPRRVVRWMCREALLQYLTGKLAEFTQHAPAALREQLLFFFHLPPAAQMTDEELAEMSERLLRAEAQRMSRALLACRVCDPAAGTGTLLAGMLEELAAALAKLDLLLYGRGLLQQHNYEFRLKRKLVNECLFGVDVQEQAVALCRQRLWLALVACEQSAPDAALAVTIREAASAPGLFQHLACGDSLLGCRAYDDGGADNQQATFKWRQAFPEIFQQRGGFDIVIGNPPYRVETGQTAWAQVGALFPQAKRTKNIAAAFFDLPRLLGAPGVIACQIVPKAVTLAEGWAATRALLRLNYQLLSAADVSEAYHEAQLEQEVLLYRRDHERDDNTAEFNATVAPAAAPKLEESYALSGDEIVKVENAAPAAALPLTPVGRELLERLSRLRTLGEFVTSKRGQRWQHRVKAGARQATAVSVIKGANLRQFRITDELPQMEPPAYSQRVLEELRQPKLVCANTLAHLKKPHETLVLLCALERGGSVTLDTVHQLSPAQDCPYSLELLCGVLNSSFARWYFFNVTARQSARAVAFEAAHIGQLPLPRARHRLVPQVEKQVRKLLKLDLPRKYCLRGQVAEYDALDDLICELYELSEEEQREVLG